MSSQLTQKEKSARAKELAILNKKMSDRFRQYRLGKEDEALLEEEFIFEDNRYAVGHTKEYIKIAIPIIGEIEKYSNKLAMGKIDKILTDDILLMSEFSLR